jgi:hypothetical protein
MGLLEQQNDSLLPVTANPKMLAQALKARQQPRKQLDGQGLLDTAAIGLSPIPGVGDVLGLAADASRFYNEPESRTPMNFGLAALGLIPFVPPLVSAGLGKFAQSQGKSLAQAPTGPGRNQAGAIVYHGSPHKFDQFDSSKIGTGEGAQAYGHGLYFAENPSVAGNYAQTLADKPKDLMGSYIEYAAKYGRPKGEQSTSFGYLKEQGIPTEHAPLLDKIIEGAEVGKDGSITYSDGAMRAFKELDRKYQTKGTTYKVDLPDEAIAKMLDWDKPLSQQSKEVQGALNKIGIPNIWKNQIGHSIDKSAPQADMVYGVLSDHMKTGADAYKKVSGFDSKINVAQKAIASGNDPAELLKTMFSGISDKEISQAVAMAKRPSGDSLASSILRDAGIPGIRYLDGGSRGAGEGTRNFVVFPGNEGLLKILERQ